MSLFALPVTVSDLTTLQQGIQFFTNVPEATTEAALINNPPFTATVNSYAQQLLAANISFSQVAMAVDSLMFGVTDNTTELAKLSTQFLPPQVAFAISKGFNPTVYAAEALGLALAGGNGTSNNFAVNFGGLTVSQFAVAVSNLTGTSTAAIEGFVANWIFFYSGVGSGAHPGLSVTLAAYGAAFGDAVGVALLNPSGALVQAQVQNALIDNALGLYQVGVPIGSLQQHPALQGDTAQTFTLTPNVDTVGPQFTTVNGTAGGANQTLTDGDNITGGLAFPPGVNTFPAQTVNILVAGPGLPGVATINGSTLVNITAAVSNTLNALNWSNIPTIEVIPTAQNVNTGISNAPITSKYFLNAPNNNGGMIIGFNTTGVGNFEVRSGIAPAAPTPAIFGLLDATGTAGVNGQPNALTGANIQFDGPINWINVNLGTNAHNITMTGAAQDFINFGALPTSGGLKVDWHTMTANQIITFQPGALNTNTGNVVQLLGGTGTGDSVTALGMTVSEKLTMSGVENLTTSFLTDTVFDGTNVTGLHTVTVAAPDVFASFINMATDFSALNVTGPVEPVLVNYAALAPNLTVTFSGNPAPVPFDGLTVQNVTNVTVDFNDAGGFNGLTGQIFVDPAHTKVLTVENLADGSNDFVTLAGTSGLTDLVVNAVGSDSTMSVFSSVNINTPGANVTVNAIGNDAHAAFTGDIINDDGGFGTISVIATGVGSDADMETISTERDVGTINVLAIGAASVADLDTAEVDGDIGIVNIIASGAASSAFISSIDPHSVGQVNVTASGAASFASLSSMTLSGSLGAITVLASGTNANAEAGDGSITISGNVGTVSVLATANDASASLFNFDVEGSINTIIVRASGGGSTAFASVTAEQVEGASVIASGVDSNATLSIDIDSGAVLGPVIVQATGANSDADLFLDLADNGFSTITVTTVASASATVSISSDQTQLGGVITESGAGNFTVNSFEQGGFTVNANGSGTFIMDFDPAVSGEPVTLNTVVNSLGHHNLIDFDDNALTNSGVVTANFANATPGVAGQGNTFDFTEQHPYGTAGLDVSTAAGRAQLFVNDIIQSGFTSGGNNFFDAVGQLDLGDDAGTLANLAQGGNFASIQLLFAAGAAALTGTGGVEYFFGTVGANGFVMVDNTAVAATVTDVVELVGVTTVNFFDFVA